MKKKKYKDMTNEEKIVSDLHDISWSILVFIPLLLLCFILLIATLNVRISYVDVPADKDSSADTSADISQTLGFSSFPLGLDPSPYGFAFRNGAGGTLYYFYPMTTFAAYFKSAGVDTFKSMTFFCTPYISIVNEDSGYYMGGALYLDVTVYAESYTTDPSSSPFSSYTSYGFFYEFNGSTGTGTPGDPVTYVSFDSLFTNTTTSPINGFFPDVAVLTEPMIKYSAYVSHGLFYDSPTPDTGPDYLYYSFGSFYSNVDTTDYFSIRFKLNDYYIPQGEFFLYMPDLARTVTSPTSSSVSFFDAPHLGEYYSFTPFYVDIGFNQEGVNSEAWQNYWNQYYNNGYNKGYESGYNAGSSDSDTFANMIFAVVDAPVKTINGLLDFEVLGVNMRNFFLSLVSVTLIGFIISKFR